MGGQGQNDTQIVPSTAARNKRETFCIKTFGTAPPVHAPNRRYNGAFARCAACVAGGFPGVFPAAPPEPEVWVFCAGAFAPAELGALHAGRRTRAGGGRRWRRRRGPGEFTNHRHMRPSTTHHGKTLSLPPPPPRSRRCPVQLRGVICHLSSSGGAQQDSAAMAVCGRRNQSMVNSAPPVTSAHAHANVT